MSSRKTRPPGTEVIRQGGSAACLAFLAVLGVGAVLVASVKLQFPSLGTGASPLEVFDAIVIVSLGALGATVRLGNLGISAVPLGALAVSGAGIAWAARNSIGTPRASTAGRVVSGATLGPFLGFLCAAAAAVFKLREGADPVSVSILGAGVVGTVWGTIFGGLGGALRGSSARGMREKAARALRELNLGIVEVILSAGTCLAVLVTGGAVAVLGALVYRLASSPLPDGFGVGDAVAGAVYLLAFLPNVIFAVLAISVGGGVDVGARVTAGGERVGPLVHYSLSAWGRGESPPITYLLLVIPLVAFGVTGFLISARSADRRKVVVRLVTCAVAVTLVLGLLWIASDARLGGGLVTGRGVAKVAVETASAMPFAFGWALGMGLVGWALHETLERRRV